MKVSLEVASRTSHATLCSPWAGNLADAAAALEGAPVNTDEPVVALRPVYMPRLRTREGGVARDRRGAAKLPPSLVCWVGTRSCSGMEVGGRVTSSAPRRASRREASARRLDGPQGRACSSVSPVAQRHAHLARLDLDDHVVGVQGEAEAALTALEGQGHWRARSGRGGGRRGRILDDGGMLVLPLAVSLFETLGRSESLVEVLAQLPSQGLSTGHGGA